MGQVKFPENYYSFRHTARIFDTIAEPLTAEVVPLAVIEAKLVAANKAYLARQYQNAITAYQEAGTLIYSHLDPSFSYGMQGALLPPDLRFDAGSTVATLF